MSLFRRSVSLEITSHTSMVFSTLIIIWLSVLFVRLLGQVSQGIIGIDLIAAIAALSTLTGLPVILALALFLGVIMTISRNYRENEMIIWFVSGNPLRSWIRPTLYVAIPVFLISAFLCLWASPWAYQQIGEYKVRFQNRSDLSKVVTGEFLDTNHGQDVIYIEPTHNPDQPLGTVFAIHHDKNWQSIIVADSAKIKTNPQNERFIYLKQGNRYDLRLHSPQFRSVQFNDYTIRVNHTSAEKQRAQILNIINNQIKARPTNYLLSDNSPDSYAQLFWRISLPIATLLLPFLGIPLGAVNPRIGKSGALIIAALLAVVYMNVLTLARNWIEDGVIHYIPALILIHGTVILLTIGLFWWRSRTK